MKKLINISAALTLIAGMVMASGEINLQGYLSATKGARSIARSPGTVAIDWIGTKYAGPVVYTATSNYQFMAAINFTNGIAWLRNVGGNSSVTLSFDGGVTDHLQIKTNEFYSMRFAPGYSLTSLGYKLTTTGTNYTGNDWEFTILEN